MPLPEPGAPFTVGRRGVREMGKKKGERECYLPMTEMSIGLIGWVGDEVLGRLFVILEYETFKERDSLEPFLTT